MLLVVMIDSTNNDLLFIPAVQLKGIHLEVDSETGTWVLMMIVASPLHFACPSTTELREYYG